MTLSTSGKNISFCKYKYSVVSPSYTSMLNIVGFISLYLSLIKILIQLHANLNYYDYLHLSSLMDILSQNVLRTLCEVLQLFASGKATVFSSKTKWTNIWIIIILVIRNITFLSCMKTLREDRFMLIETFPRYIEMHLMFKRSKCT